MAKDEKRKTRIEVGVKLKASGRSKGSGGGVSVQPKAKLVRKREKKGSDRKDDRQRQASAEHLFELSVQERTSAARRVTAGDRVEMLGPGPRLVILSSHGALGLASYQASETSRAALAAEPGARLDVRVSAIDEAGVRLRVSLVRATDGERRGILPAAALKRGDVAAPASSAGRGR